MSRMIDVGSAPRRLLLLLVLLATGAVAILVETGLSTASPPSLPAAVNLPRATPVPVPLTPTAAAPATSPPSLAIPAPPAASGAAPAPSTARPPAVHPPLTVVSPQRPVQNLDDATHSSPSPRATRADG